MARAIARILFALMGAAIGAVAVALVEAQPTEAGGAHGPGFVAIALADLGVLAPIALLLGAGVGVATLFLTPDAPVGPFEVAAALRAEPVLARSRTAAMALLGFGVAAAWLVTTAQVARRVLGEGSPSGAGRSRSGRRACRT